MVSSILVNEELASQSIEEQSSNQSLFAKFERKIDDAFHQHQQIHKRLKEFQGLAFNWDGDNADGVSKSTLKLAGQVADLLIFSGIKIEFAVPMRNGGIQFEFDLESECEIEVHPNGDVFFLNYDGSGTLMEKEKITLIQLKKYA